MFLNSCLVFIMMIYSSLLINQNKFWDKYFKKTNSSRLQIYNEFIKAPFYMPIYVEGENNSLKSFSPNWTMKESDDLGKSWTKAKKVLKNDSLRNSVKAVIRLKNGDLGFLSTYTNAASEDINNYHKINNIYWYVSKDDGKTVSKPVIINRTGGMGLPYYDSVIQKRDGSIIIPVRKFNEGFNDSTALLTFPKFINDPSITIESHAHKPELDASFIYFSNDNGETWSRSRNEIFIWKDDGEGGMWPFDEPNVIEKEDGSLLMYGRTSLGRIFFSISSDHVNWTLPMPTQISSSYSPCRLKKIPETKDLILIWNDVSTAEIQKGYRRGRLSIAISRNNGLSWENKKTICNVNVGRINTSGLNEIVMSRANKEVNIRSFENFNYVHYPNVSFYKNNILISFLDKKDTYTIIKEISWLYEK
jgi:hypothetical protein